MWKSSESKEKETADLKEKQNPLGKNLLLLLWGRMVSDTGSRVQLIVIPLYTLDTGGSAATVGLFTFLSIVPALLIYPLAGVLGDRWNRKTIMVLTDLLSGGVILLLALLSHMGRMSLGMMICAQALIALLNGLFDPATKGILPQLVNREHLSRANSALYSMRTLSGLAGPVIGTALYAAFGISILFLINGVSFLLSGISEMFIHYRHHTAMEKQGMLSALREGGQFVLGKPSIRALCLFLLAIYALVMPMFQVLLPLLFRTRLAYTDTQYGLLQIVVMLGALLGGILTGVLFGKAGQERSALKLGLVLLAGSAVLFTILVIPDILAVLGTDTLRYLGLLSGVAGMLSAAVIFLNVPLQTVIQQQTPEPLLSRVFSVVGLITKGGLPFGALLYGAALDRLALHAATLCFTALTVLVSVLFLAGLRSCAHEAP